MCRIVNLVSFIAFSCVAASMCGCGDNGQSRKTIDGSVSWTSLSDEKKNEIWWEFEASLNQIDKTFTKRFEQDNTQDAAALMLEVAREVREPIAQKYGLTYLEAKALFNAGESGSVADKETLVSGACATIKHRPLST